MALGLDPRFDLTHAYFLVAGIGGIDPAWARWPRRSGPTGSSMATWRTRSTPARFRRLPRKSAKLWTTGYVPLGKIVAVRAAARCTSRRRSDVYHLNPALVTWAFNLTKDIALPDDNPEIAAADARNSPAPPRIGLRSCCAATTSAASTFWHGKLLNQWARDWVKYQTDGKGTYAICGMEDTGTLQSLTWLAHARKVDINRVLVLRTASNYDQQREGITAAESLAETKVGQYSAYMPSLEAAYRVGHLVVDRLVADWPQTRDHIPAAQ